MTLTAVLKWNQENGFTAAFQELPPFLTDGLNEEGALGNLVAESARCLTWKSVQDWHASQGRALPDDGVGLQIP